MTGVERYDVLLYLFFLLFTSRLLKEKVFEETGVSLNLFVTAPSDASQPDAPQVADYIILLDCRKDIPVDTDSMVLRISEQKEWSWD